MYLTLRYYVGVGTRINEIARKVEDGLVPRLKQSPGFMGYCAVGCENGDALSVTLFESGGQASEANEQARSWVQSDLRDLLPDPPEVFSGEAVIHAGVAGNNGNFSSPLYVLVRKFDNIREPDKAEEFTRQVSVPSISSSPGFRGFYAVWGDPGRSRAAIATLFDSRENADQSNERVIALIREKGGSVVPPPTRIVVGKALVVAAAA
jgi:hypothetical protein